VPISDKKKCQTFINLCAAAAEQAQAAVINLKLYRAAYIAQSVDPTGTPLEGNAAAVSGWIDDMETAAGATVANAMIAAKRPTHKNQALEV